MTRDTASQYSEDTDPLVSMALAKHLTTNMGANTYQKYVRSQLGKNERDSPILIAWQLLAEARKVSELDLAKRYVKLLQPTTPRTPQQLTVAYQAQIDEEEELIMQGFACKCRTREVHFKKALLDMCDKFGVLQTRIEIAWHENKGDQTAALQSVKQEIVDFCATQPGGTVAALGPPTVESKFRSFGESTNDQICRNYMKTGRCSYGIKCKFKHVKGDLLPTVMLSIAQQGDDVNDEIVAMYQEKENAEQHPEMAMLIIAQQNGISLDDDEPEDF